MHSFPVEYSASEEPAGLPRPRPSGSQRSRGAPPPPPKRPAGDLLKRRAIAFGIAVLIIVLLLLGLRACLDARKERSFENYLRDLESLTADSAQLSSTFFGALRDPGQASEGEFETQINTTRNSVEALVDRAQGLDTPDDLAEAQTNLELAFELRADAMDKIVEQILIALGDQGRVKATEEIAIEMRTLLASDVLYARAKSEIESVLSEQDLAGKVAASVFLPEPIEPWLDRLEVISLINQVVGETTGVADGTRGTEISSTVLRPGNVPLTPDTLNTVKLPGEVEIEVLNGGAQDEVDLVVAYEILGSTDQVEGEMTIARIGPGATGSAAIPIQGEIPADEELTLVVTVLPVPGESIIDNNESTYQVLFE